MNKYYSGIFDLINNSPEIEEKINYLSVNLWKIYYIVRCSENDIPFFQFIKDDFNIYSINENKEYINLTIKEKFIAKDYILNNHLIKKEDWNKLDLDEKRFYCCNYYKIFGKGNETKSEFVIHNLKDENNLILKIANKEEIKSFNLIVSDIDEIINFALMRYVLING